MRVKLIARLGENQRSGLEIDRGYAVHAGPDPDGRVLLFDDNTNSFRSVSPAEYREVPDPLEPHDLLRIDHDQGGWRAVCTCVWEPWEPASDPDAATKAFRSHLWHMEGQARLLTMVVHPSCWSGSTTCGPANAARSPSDDPPRPRRPGQPPQPKPGRWLMARSSSRLRDAALGYASRGIPVLPLHYPVTRPQGPRPVSAGQLERPGWPTGCSCGDAGCGQVAKHPLGTLVPHGLREATTNRARVLAWWTRYPQANIGLACGHLFDVLDLDGPEAVAALQALADRHRLDLPAGGPVARTGRPQAGWHYYLHPAGLGRRTGVLDHVDYQGQGAYVVAPPSRHASGRPYRWVRNLDHPLPQLPERLRAALERPPSPPAALALVGLPAPEGPGPGYVRSALAAELARVAGAPVGRRNHQLWESARNLFNFVAAGALDPAEVERGLLQAADCCGLADEEPRQTRRTIASARQVGLDHPRRPPQRPAPNRTSDASPTPASRDRAERTKEGR